jgi:PAS domain S-box-containing protein
MRRSIRILRNPHFWGVVAIFLILTLLHYPHNITREDRLTSFFGLQRHALERILFLAPITYAAFIFGIKGGVISLMVALAIMLPRIFLISLYPREALFETCITVVIGSLINWWFEFRRREVGRREQALLKLEAARRELQSSIQALRENERRISALHSISATVNQSLILEEVFDVAADKVKEVMDIDSVFIYFLDEESGQLELKAYRGVSEEFASEVTGLKVGEGFNGWVAQTGETCFIEDAGRDPRLTREVVRREGIKSVFIVPLKSKDKVVGTLCVATRAKKQFSPEERKLLTLIGVELGVAVEKAFFFQELQRIGRRYQEIFEKAHDAIWIQDLSGEIIAANQAASRLTGYDLEELIGKNISQFLTHQGLELEMEVERNLLVGKEVEQPYEQRVIKKNGAEAILMLTTSLLGDEKAPIFLHIARDITDERKLRENLRLYANQISKAHEEERRRIARELHDDTIQTMVAISRRLDNFISENSTIPKEMLKPLEELQRDIDESLIRIRRFVQDLRPPTLEYLGLLPALKELVAQFQDQSGIEVSLKVEGSEWHFAPEEGLLIYRIVQEAIRNVWKHSGATEAEISIKFEGGKAAVTVSDNGKGFEVKGDSELLEAGKLGLMGMKERAHLLGGSLRIISEPNRGTTVILNISRPR